MSSLSSDDVVVDVFSSIRSFKHCNIDFWSNAVAFGFQVSKGFISVLKNQYLYGGGFFYEYKSSKIDINSELYLTFPLVSLPNFTFLDVVDTFGLAQFPPDVRQYKNRKWSNEKWFHSSINLLDKSQNAGCKSSDFPNREKTISHSACLRLELPRRWLSHS